VRIWAQLGRLAVLAVALLAASFASPHTNPHDGAERLHGGGAVVGRFPGGPSSVDQGNR